MNIFKKTIPFAIVAIPLLGMASASMPAHPAYPEMTAQADSDSVSMGTVIDEVIWVVLLKTLNIVKILWKSLVYLNKKRCVCRLRWKV